MNYKKYIAEASGLAGEITMNRQRNARHNNEAMDVGETISTTVVRLGLAFGIIGVIGGCCVGGLIGCAYGLGGGVGVVVASGFTVGFTLGVVTGIGCGVADAFKASYLHRHLFFNHRSAKDVARSMATAVSSFLLASYFTLEHLIKFFYYISMTLYKLLKNKEYGFLRNSGLAADAFMKIFTNLTAVVFHPLINLCMSKGELVKKVEDTQPEISDRVVTI